MSTSQNATAHQTPSFAPLRGIDYVELFVANPRQAAHYYRTAYGFQPIAYAGQETGLRDRSSYLMQQGECFLVLTGPLTAEGPVAEYVARHGDGVKDIAFRVQNTADVFAEAVRRGAQPIMEPTRIESEAGYLIKATIATFGDVQHSFIQREGLEAGSLPGYQPRKKAPAPWTGLHALDHFAVSLPPGEVQHWVHFYMELFGFTRIHEEGINTEYSSMTSIAVQDPDEQIKFVLIEPLPGKRKSQIEEFLHYHQGAGVQHIALHTRDIVRTIEALESYGVDFVPAPESYYEMLPERVGTISEDRAALRKTNVLVDRDEWGYLLQIFALPLHNRPTLFIEIIQRKEARGFGSGNIQALFKALEREQARRGNL